MADAKLASSPSVTGDGGAASTVPPRAIEGTTAAVATACGESASVEETPEARALAQGAYSRPISLFLLSLTWAHHDDSGVLLCRHESSL